MQADRKMTLRDSCVTGLIHDVIYLRKLTCLTVVDRNNNFGFPLQVWNTNKAFITFNNKRCRLRRIE